MLETEKEEKVRGYLRSGDLKHNDFRLQMDNFQVQVPGRSLQMHVGA
jgi:hypothetical protein